MQEYVQTLNKRTDCCPYVLKHKIVGDPEVLHWLPASSDDPYPIVREEADEAVETFKNGRGPVAKLA